MKGMRLNVAGKIDASKHLLNSTYMKRRTKAAYVGLTKCDLLEAKMRREGWRFLQVPQPLLLHMNYMHPPYTRVHANFTPFVVPGSAIISCLKAYSIVPYSRQNTKS